MKVVHVIHLINRQKKWCFIVKILYTNQMSNSKQNNKLLTVNTSKNISLSRDVPMNLGAEQALLGAIISNNLAFEKIETF